MNILESLTVTEEATLLDVWKVYKQIRPLKPSTVRDYEKRLPYIAELMAMPAKQITKLHILSEYNRLRGTGKLTTANYCLRIARALLSFAAEALELPDGKPLIASNPAKIISVTRSWTPSNKRSDYIRPSDMKAWLTAAQHYPNQTIADWLVFILFTGCRRGEATGLLWENVDLVNGYVTFPNTKNGSAHVLPLSDFLWTMLRRRRETASGAFVFPGKAADTLSQWNKAIGRINADSGVSVSIHGLRRTLASAAAAAGLARETIALLLNHKSTTVTDGYIQRSPETLRAAVQAVTSELLRQAQLKCEPLKPLYLPPETQAGPGFPGASHG